MEPATEDQIVQLIGNFGKWQLMLLIPLGIHFIFGSAQTLSTSFLSMKEDYFCKIDAPQGIFESLQQWRNFSSPITENGEVDKCNVYDMDYTLLSQVALQKGATIDDFIEQEKKIKNCTEFVFDLSNFESSVITDFGLVCHNDWLVTLANAVYMFGFLLGASTSGIVSDKFGRKRTIIVFAIVYSIFSVAVAFAPSMKVFIFLRWVLAFSSIGFWTTFYVYGMEMVGGDWKTFFGIGFQLPWALAYSVLPGVAYAERNWRHLQLIISVPPIILVALYFFYPESPRWLLSQGRVEEAKAILEKAVKRNGSTWPEGLILHATNEVKKEGDTSASLLDLFRTPNLRKNTLIQYFNWFTASFVYYALTFDSGTLIPGDIYINNAIAGLIEFPAYALCIVLLYYAGRRSSLSFMYFLLGISLLISLAMPTDYGVLIVTNIGKFGAVCAFAIIYVQAVEIYPTVLRNTGIGSSSSTARIGSILAPVIGRELAKVSKVAVFVIFAVVALIAGFLTLFLPETNRKTLPESIQEGEAFGKGESAFSVCFKKQKSPAVENDGIGMENVAYHKE